MAADQPTQTASQDVRMRGFRDRTEVDVARALLFQRLGPLPAEEVDISAAAGRVLTAAVTSEVAVPAFDRAAMDGYALRAEETFGASPYNALEFQVIGDSRPGRGFQGSVARGQALRIMTGAPMPAGADAVVMAEATQPLYADPQGADRLARPTAVLIAEAVPPGRHVGHRGEDIAPGDRLLDSGRVLRPQDLAALASIGVTSVHVVRQPRVELIITGDELLPPGAIPAGRQIVDSNSLMLASLVARDGGVPRCQGIVPDQRAAVRSALLDNDADLILISGGSSVGTEDHAPTVLAEEGELAVHGVAMRPSSPAGFGFLRDRPVFLLPGNPVSCLAAYEFFAGPSVRRLGGRGTDWPHRRRRLPLARKLVSAVGRVDYVRVLIEQEKVEPIATSGASILSSTTRAAGFVIVPRDSEGHAAGESVDVYLYDA